MKKWYCVLVAAALVLGLPLGVGAAANKIEGVNESYWSSMGAQDYADHNGRLDGSPVDSLVGITVQAGSKIKVDLIPEAFVDADGNSMDQNGWRVVTLSQLMAGRIDVRKQVSSGSQLLEKVELDYNKGGSGTAFISIEFVDDFVSTREQDFSFQVYLTERGRKNTETTFQVSGTIKNETVILRANDDYVDLSSGLVAEAKDYIKTIRADLGNGVSITTSMFEGSKYYGTAKVELTAQDERLLDSYPDIAMVYTLRTIGLKKEGSRIVSFDLPTSYYVYDSKGAYLGTTASAVAYSPKYYLSTRQLDRLNLPESM